MIFLEYKLQIYNVNCRKILFHKSLKSNIYVVIKLNLSSLNLISNFLSIPGFIERIKC